jgi:DNA-binding response OmpR family regulator
MARIYIADDDADIRSVLSFSLAQRGHQVSAAQDGKGVVTAVSEDAPDLLVLDLIMPNVDGYRVLNDLEASGLRNEVKVLVVTARNSEQDRVEVFERGADGYLSKPFEPEEFLEAVEDLLEASPEELRRHREHERDQASLLAQLESVFGEMEP